MASSRMTYKEKLLLESFRPKPPELVLKEELNRGAYGVVHRGVFGDRPVAVKKIHELLFDEDRSKVEIERAITGFKKEADMLETVQHPHVVKSLGAYYDPKTREPILVMELMAMDLRTFLKKHEGPGALKVSKQVNICFQIALGLQYLHHLSPPLAHRDLNDKNVLLAEDGTVKIGDLGQSKYKNTKDIYYDSKAPGNIIFMPPEATSDNPHYTESVDIFSLGVLVVEVATQSEPSPSVHGIGVVPEVERRANDLKKMEDDHPLKPLVLNFLKNNYKERPDIDHVVATISEIFILEVNKDSEQDRRDRVSADKRHKEGKAQFTVKETVSCLEASNHMLTKDLDAAKKEIDARIQHEEKITRELRASNEGKSRLQETLLRLHASNRELTKDLDAAKKEIDARIQHEVEITRELRASSEEKSRLQHQYQVLSQQYHDSQRRTKELKNEVHPAAKPFLTHSDSSHRIEDGCLGGVPFAQLFKMSQREVYKAALHERYSMRTLEAKTQAVFESFESAGEEVVVAQTELIECLQKGFGQPERFSLRGIFGYSGHTYNVEQAHENASKPIERLYQLYQEIKQIIQDDKVGHHFPEVHNLLFAHLAGVHMHGVRDKGEELCLAAETLAIYHRIRKQVEEQIKSDRTLYKQFLKLFNFSSSGISPPQFAFPVGFKCTEGGLVEIAYTVGDKVEVTQLPTTSKETNMRILKTACIDTLEKEMETIATLCNLPEQ